MSTSDTDSLIAFLSRRDAFCPGCNYSLRGLTVDRCPECHGRLVLTVALADPPIVPFVLAILGLAACGTASGFVIAGVVVISVLENVAPDGEESMALLWVPAIVLVADYIAVAWLLQPARRCGFAKRSSLGRWRMVLWCWAVSLAVFAGWLALLLLFT